MKAETSDVTDEVLVDDAVEIVEVMEAVDDAVEIVEEEILDDHADAVHLDEMGLVVIDDSKVMLVLAVAITLTDLAETMISDQHLEVMIALVEKDLHLEEVITLTDLVEMTISDHLEEEKVVKNQLVLVD